MFNVGGGEFLVIALVALIVLGPDKLPEMARKVGNVLAEVRAMSNGFQREMRDAMNDPVDVALRDRDGTVRPRGTGDRRPTTASDDTESLGDAGPTGDAGPGPSSPPPDER
jgi:sec-independent protein translocase protein TatB